MTAEETIPLGISHPTGALQVTGWLFLAATGEDLAGNNMALMTGRRQGQRAHPKPMSALLQPLGQSNPAWGGGAWRPHRILWSWCHRDDGNSELKANYSVGSDHHRDFKQQVPCLRARTRGGLASNVKTNPNSGNTALTCIIHSPISAI